jgi:hypothetical protein
MHHHPSIPPHLFALSIRIHLSIAHTLECKTAAAVSQQDLGLAIRLSEAVADSLEDAMTIEGSGVRQGWIGSIVKQEVGLVLIGATERARHANQSRFTRVGNGPIESLASRVASHRSATLSTSSACVNSGLLRCR